MHFLEIYFRKHLAALERLTNIRVLFVAVLSVTVATGFLFLNSLSHYHIADPPYEVAPPLGSPSPISSAMRWSVHARREHRPPTSPASRTGIRRGSPRS